jgi:hypothetical protein
MPQRRGGESHIPGHRDRGAKFLYCTIDVTLLLVSQSKEIGQPEGIRIEFAGLPALLDALLVLARKMIVPGHVYIHDEVERIKLQASLARLQRFLGSPDSSEVMRVPVVTNDIVGVQFKGMLKLGFGAAS